MGLGQSLTSMEILGAQAEAWRLLNVEEKGYCDDELFYLLTDVDCRFKSPDGNLICSFSIEPFPYTFSCVSSSRSTSQTGHDSSARIISNAVPHIS